MDIHVVKKDGTLEVYDESKIVRIVVAAGLTPEEGQTLASNITKWINENSLTKVTTLELRGKVLEGLKAASEYAANLYLWYEKSKDNPTGQ